MKSAVLVILVLTTAFITGFGAASYDLFGKPIMESSISDWGWSAQYCDKETYVYMKLNGVITGKQIFHEYCNI